VSTAYKEARKRFMQLREFERNSRATWPVINKKTAHELVAECEPLDVDGADYRIRMRLENKSL
jgi:hypothetical protein